MSAHSNWKQDAADICGGPGKGGSERDCRSINDRPFVSSLTVVLLRSPGT